MDHLLSPKPFLQPDSTKNSRGMPQPDGARVLLRVLLLTRKSVLSLTAETGWASIGRVPRRASNAFDRVVDSIVSQSRNAAKEECRCGVDSVGDVEVRCQG